MQRQGASRLVFIRMLLNIILDAVISIVPGIGTIFDVGYKANQRNVRLLLAHYVEGRHQGSGCGLLLFMLLVSLGVIGGMLYALIWGIRWMFTI